MSSEAPRVLQLVPLFWRVTERPLRLRIVMLFLAMLIAALVEIASLAGVQTYFSFLLARETSAGNAVTTLVADLNLRNQTIVLSSALGLVLLLKLIVSLLTNGMLARTASSFQIMLATRLFAAYQNAPLAWFVERNTSDLQRNLLHDVNQVTGSIVIPILQLTLNGVISIALFTFIFMTLSPGLLLVMGGIVVLLVTVGLLAQQVLVEAGKRARVASSDTLKAAREGMHAMTEARILGCGSAFISEFRRAQSQLGWALRRRIFFMQSVPIVLETLIMIAFVVIVTTLVVSSDRIESALAASAVLAVAVFRLRQVTNKIVTSINMIGSASASLPPLVADIELLEPFSAQVPRFVRRPDTGFSTLRFNKAQFRYPKQNIPAIVGATLELRRGEHVAVMGASGAGKSTFLLILLGLIKVTKGAVEVDGRPISKVLAEWYAQIGYVPQQVFLVDDTIAANVALGVPDKDCDPDQIREALEQAQLWEFVSRLPAGINTPVGEDGSALSGGQRQRIGIARALFRKPTVIVLDEATSALDRDTQDRVMQELANLPQNATIVSVTHHLEPLDYADRLIVLEAGHIAADGTVADVWRHDAFRRITRAEVLEASV